MTYDLKSLKNRWNQSVGRASGISFDVAMILSKDPDELEKILSDSGSGMNVLSRIKKQYDTAERLLKFASKFKEPSIGHGALPGNWAERLRSGRPPNMGGITEHFERAKHNPFNYKALNPFGWWNGVRGGYTRKPLPESKFPLVTSSTAAEFRLKDEKQRIAAMASMNNATAAFYGTRNNQNWDDYLTGRTGDWSNYDPSSGPLGDLFRNQERDERRRSAVFGAHESIRQYEQEDIEEQRRARIERMRERRQRESRNSIAVRSKQIDAYRKFPWIKSLVDAGLIQKKELPKISKNLEKAKKIPFIGHIAKNPFLFSGSAIAAIIAGYVNKQNAANEKTTLWENAEMFFGKPTKSFSDAANKALITDPKAIASFWGKLSSKGYDPDAVLRVIGKATTGKPSVVKNAIASRFGLTPDEIVAAEFLAGGIGESSSRKQARRLKQLEVEETRGFKSGAGLTERLRSLLLWLPGEKSLESRDMSWLTLGFESLFAPSRVLRKTLDTKPVFDLFGNWERQQRETEAAAESANDYDAGRIGNRQASTGTNVSKSIAFNIGTLQVDAENSEQLIQSLMKEGAERDHLGIIEATDTRIRV